MINLLTPVLFLRQFDWKNDTGDLKRNRWNRAIRGLDIEISCLSHDQGKFLDIDLDPTKAVKGIASKIGLTNSYDKEKENLIALSDLPGEIEKEKKIKQKSKGFDSR
jgi:hypothetical protein